jgi:hypothetical protein
MKIERIRISATVYSTEDPEKVAEAISAIIPFEFEISTTKAEGHFGNPLMYLEVEITGKKRIKSFWNNLMKLLEDQKNILLNELDLRVDENGFLHIRIDKQEAYMGRVKLISRGDGIVCRIKITTYPLKREKVIEAAKEMILNGY